MSHYAEERYSVYVETCVTANKEHRCSACRILIPKRGRYYRVSWIYDGAAYSVKRCLACQTTHEHLRELGEPDGMWPDERLNCGESYESHWGAIPPEIAELAFWRYGDPLPAHNVCTKENYYSWPEPYVHFPRYMFNDVRIARCVPCFVDHSPDALFACL